MMGHNYSKVALVRNCTDGKQYHLDKDGNEIFSEAIGNKQFEQEILNHVIVQEKFIQVGRYHIAFNPTHIAAIHVEEKEKKLELEFQNNQGKKIYKGDFSDDKSLSPKKLPEIFGDGFTQVAGKWEFINVSLAQAERQKRQLEKPKQSPTEKEILKNLPADLKKVIFGQNKPVDSVVQAIWRAAAGLQAPDKPIGSFLFLGPTGVGKTELAEQVAKKLDRPFKKFDMSDYAQDHQVSRLIGSPPGYINHSDGGQLTNFVRENKNAVLLFDEIEKAHPDVPMILLGMLDKAQLDDSDGKPVSFKDCIIILTSNLSLDQHYKAHWKRSLATDAEVVASSGLDARNDPAVKYYFPPEFLNRLDEVVRFQPLSKEIMNLIVDKFVGKLQAHLAEKNVKLSVSPHAKEWLLNKGANADLGARPLERIIQTELADPLAQEILFGDLQGGGLVQVDMNWNKPPTETRNRLIFAFNEMMDGEELANDNAPPEKLKTASAGVQAPRPA